MEPWMLGPVEGLHPVIGHLLRASQQIREDAQAAICDLTAEQIWAKPLGVTSAGFHAKHLAGSTNRLLTYLDGAQLSEEQLAAIAREGTGTESAQELLASIAAAFDRYDETVRALNPDEFGAVREIGRKKHRTAAISVAIHIVEHSQRHIGGLIAAAKLARGEL